MVGEASINFELLNDAVLSSIERVEVILLLLLPLPLLLYALSALMLFLIRGVFGGTACIEGKTLGVFGEDRLVEEAVVPNEGLFWEVEADDEVVLVMLK